MKHESITKIFWGIFLLFFNISYNNLNLYTTLLGVLLLVTATWQLNAESVKFKKAFYSCVLQLILQTANLIFICTKFGNNATMSLISTVIGALNLIFMFFNLFSGLSDMAQAQGHEELARSLHKCFYLYVLIDILILGLTIFSAATILLPVALIIFIYILLKVGRLNANINNSDNVFTEKSLNRRFFTLLSAYLCVTALLLFAVLYFTNCTFVHIESYNKNDVANATETESIKAKMLSSGFDKEILTDLPDSEIEKYKGIKSFHETINNQPTDGGKVKIIACVSTFKGGNIRFLDYYKWLKNPRHHLSDVFGLNYQVSYVTMPNNQQWSGAAIYDKKTPSGVTTYKADWVEEQSAKANIGYKFPKVKCRIFGDGATNQRGFIAIDAAMSSPKQAVMYNTGLIYCHQSSILNIGYKNAFDLYQSESVSQDPTGFLFERYLLTTSEEYKP